MKSAAKKRWGLFYDADGQKKTGGGVSNIPPLTAVEENFLARVSWKYLLSFTIRLNFLAETALNVRLRSTSSRMCSARSTFPSNFLAPEVVRTPDTYATISNG